MKTLLICIEEMSTCSGECQSSFDLMKRLLTSESITVNVTHV
jgi:hypothetical protein